MRQGAGRFAAAVLGGLAVLAGLGPWNAARAAGGERPAILAVTAEEGREDDEARLVFATDRPVEPEVFTLTGPARLVIDLAPFDWRAGRVAPDDLPFVGTLRHGLFRHDRGRIVLGLEEPVAVRRVETVRGGEGAPGVALTLAPTEPEGFALTAGWPPGARWEPEAPRDRPETEDVVVLIDPGHGGIDPGASSHGLVEKTIVLDFGHRLRAHVDAVPGVTAVMTREDDRFVPLRARLAIAREVGANVLVSLHTDALASGEADGVSFYTLSRRGVDSAAEAFAERENRSDVIAGADLSGREDTLARVLIDLARRGTNAESIALARGMRGLLDGAVDLLDTRPHRFGNFYVLKAPDMPSVLVELGFLNSAADRERLTDPAWQETVAARLATAIERWVAEAPEGFLERRGF